MDSLMPFSSPTNPELTLFECDGNLRDPEKLLKGKEVKSRIAGLSGIGRGDKSFIINDIIESEQRERVAKKGGPKMQDEPQKMLKTSKIII